MEKHGKLTCRDEVVIHILCIGHSHLTRSYLLKKEQAPVCEISHVASTVEHVRTIIMANCIIRGDLANVRIGRHCVVSQNTVIRPPFKKFSKGVAFFPLHIGDHVVIEEGTVVNAAQVGSFVHIGKNCVIGRRCVLKDCCAVADNTVLPPETVVPPFTVYSGSPGKLLADLPECSQDLMIDITRNFYQHFIPDSKQGL